MKFKRTNMIQQNSSAVIKPKSNWSKDRLFEEESTRFLIRSHILMQIGTKTIIEDKDRQLQGIDLICDIPFGDGRVEESQNVDIKAIASKLPTFCFEIAGNTHSGQIGWFINQNLLTDYYLIVYHDIENSQNYSKNKDNMTVENVVYTKALLIKKEKLQEKVLDYFFLDSLDDLQGIVDKIKEMSEGETKATVYKYDGVAVKPLNVHDKQNERMWLSSSNHLHEKPVNVVIRQQFLESIADKVFELDEDGEAICPKRSLQQEYEVEKAYFDWKNKKRFDA